LDFLLFFVSGRNKEYPIAFGEYENIYQQPFEKLKTRHWPDI